MKRWNWHHYRINALSLNARVYHNFEWMFERVNEWINDRYMSEKEELSSLFDVSVISKQINIIYGQWYHCSNPFALSEFPRLRYQMEFETKSNANDKWN